MSLRPLSFAFAGAVVLGVAQQAAAGGKPVECYQPYHTPAAYQTVYQDVVVHPARRQVDYTPPIYGTRERAVVVAPSYVRWEATPPVTRVQYRTVRIDDGGYGWEWRWINGKRVLCKVKRAPRYERVAETVVVRPGQKRKVVVPAEIDYVTEQVVVRPGYERVIDVPATYQTVARRVMVSEGSSGWKRVHIPRHC